MPATLARRGLLAVTALVIAGCVSGAHAARPPTPADVRAAVTRTEAVASGHVVMTITAVDADGSTASMRAEGFFDHVHRLSSMTVDMVPSLPGWGNHIEAVISDTTTDVRVSGVGPSSTAQKWLRLPSDSTVLRLADPVRLLDVLQESKAPGDVSIGDDGFVRRAVVDLDGVRIVLELSGLGEPVTITVPAPGVVTEKPN